MKLLFYHDQDEQKPIIFFNNEGKKIDFIFWTYNSDLEFLLPELRGSLILQQMFVVPDERRQGYATEMIKYWEEEHTKISSKFGVEVTVCSPVKPL